MTCIAAIVENDHVYMGGDSCGAAGTPYTIRKDAKVFRLGECVVGYTLSFRMGQILQYRMSPPQLDGVIDLHRYFVAEWGDQLRITLESNGWKDGPVILIGCRGELFEIQQDFQVVHHSRPYAAVGSGEPLAEGALFVVRNEPLLPKAKLFLALSAAAEHCTDVKPPFVYASTENP